MAVCKGIKIDHAQLNGSRAPLRLGASEGSISPDLPESILQAEGPNGRYTPEQNRLMMDTVKEALANARSAGIESIEFRVITARDTGMLAETINEAKAEGYDLDVWSVHAPYGLHMDPCLPGEEIRQAAVDMYAFTLDMINRIGAKVMIIHPGKYDDPEDRQAHLERSAKNLTEVADMAADAGVILAVEIVPRKQIGNSIEELVWIVDQINRPNVGFCLDTNHLFPASKLPAAIKTLGDRLVSVHASDHNDIEECHRLPFEGVVDWKSVVNSLRGIGYPGPLIHEVRRFGTHKETARAIAERYNRMMEA